jgi:energy-coupling factor transporter ATP-binding protein EcfA2
MSIFSTTFDPKTGIKQDANIISLICFDCQKSFFTTTFKEFRCQHCETYYNLEQYQVRFMSLLSSVIFQGRQQKTDPVVVTEATSAPPPIEPPDKPKAPTPPEPDPIDNMFNDVYGESSEEIKTVLKSALRSDRNIHVLIGGPPGQGKTVFLQCIKKVFPDAEYIDATMLTKSGLAAFLEKNRTKTKLLIDELDKLDPENEKVLLNLMATGILRVVKHGKDINLHFPKLQIIATGNEIHKIYNAIRDRFLVLTQPLYSKDEFYFIADKILTGKFKFSKDFAAYCIDQVYNKLQNPTIRQLQILAGLVEPKQTKEYVDKFITIVNKFD